MKIALSTFKPELDGDIDPRFGRCQYFLIADTDRDDFETLENPHCGAGGGAGVATAQLVASKGAKAVITGSIGPNAFGVLSAAGIAMYAGVSGKVRDALHAFRAGNLQALQQPQMGQGAGMGPGAGGGMGMGRGGRRGMGQGGGAGMGLGRGRGRGCGAGRR